MSYSIFFGYLVFLKFYFFKSIVSKLFYIFFGLCFLRYSIFFRSMVPKIFYVTEKAWNYYPFTITQYSVSRNLIFNCYLNSTFNLSFKRTMYFTNTGVYIFQNIATHPRGDTLFLDRFQAPNCSI